MCRRYAPRWAIPKGLKFMGIDNLPSISIGGYIWDFATQNYNSAEFCVFAVNHQKINQICDYPRLLREK